MSDFRHVAPLAHFIRAKGDIWGASTNYTAQQLAAHAVALHKLGVGLLFKVPPEAEVQGVNMAAEKPPTSGNDTQPERGVFFKAKFGEPRVN